MRRVLLTALLFLTGCREQSQTTAATPAVNAPTDVVAVRGAQILNATNGQTAPTDVIAEGQQVREQAQQVVDRANDRNKQSQQASDLQ